MVTFSQQAVELEKQRRELGFQDERMKMWQREAYLRENVDTAWMVAAQRVIGTQMFLNSVPAAKALENIRWNVGSIISDVSTTAQAMLSHNCDVITKLPKPIHEVWLHARPMMIQRGVSYMTAPRVPTDAVNLFFTTQVKDVTKSGHLALMGNALPFVILDVHKVQWISEGEIRVVGTTMFTDPKLTRMYERGKETAPDYVPSWLRHGSEVLVVLKCTGSNNGLVYKAHLYEPR